MISKKWFFLLYERWRRVTVVGECLEWNLAEKKWVMITKVASSQSLFVYCAAVVVVAMPFRLIEFAAARFERVPLFCQTHKIIFFSYTFYIFAPLRLDGWTWHITVQRSTVKNLFHVNEIHILLLALMLALLSQMRESPTTRKCVLKWAWAWTSSREGRRGLGEWVKVAKSKKTQNIFISSMREIEIPLFNK